jgi:hypothetical protein
MHALKNENSVLEGGGWMWARSRSVVIGQEAPGQGGVKPLAEAERVNSTDKSTVFALYGTQTFKKNLNV